MTLCSSIGHCSSHRFFSKNTERNNRSSISFFNLPTRTSKYYQPVFVGVIIVGQKTVMVG